MSDDEQYDDDDQGEEPEVDEDENRTEDGGADDTRPRRKKKGPKPSLPEHPMNSLMVPLDKLPITREQIESAITVKELVTAIRYSNDKFTKENSGMPKPLLQGFVSDRALAHWGWYLQFNDGEDVFWCYTHFQRVLKIKGNFTTKNGVPCPVAIRIVVQDGVTYALFERYMYYTGAVNPVSRNDDMQIFQPFTVMPMDPNVIGAAKVIKTIHELVEERKEVPDLLLDAFRGFLRTVAKGQATRDWGYYMTSTTIDKVEVRMPFGKNDKSFMILNPLGLVELMQLDYIDKATMQQMLDDTKMATKAFEESMITRPVSKAPPTPEQRPSRRKRRVAGGGAQAEPDETDEEEEEAGGGEANPNVFRGKDGEDFPVPLDYAKEFWKIKPPEPRDPPLGQKTILPLSSDCMVQARAKYYKDLVPAGSNEKVMKEEVQDRLLRIIAENLAATVLSFDKFGLMVSPLADTEVVWTPTITLTDAAKASCLQLLAAVSQLATSQAPHTIYLGYLVADADHAMLIYRVVSVMAKNEKIRKKIFRMLDILDERDKESFVKRGHLKELLFSYVHFYLKTLVSSVKQEWARQVRRQGAHVEPALLTIAPKRDIVKVVIESSPETQPTRERLEGLLGPQAFRMSHTPSPFTVYVPYYVAGNADERRPASRSEWGVVVGQLLHDAYDPVFSTCDPKPDTTIYKPIKSVTQCYKHTYEILLDILEQKRSFQRETLMKWAGDLAASVFRNLVWGQALDYFVMSDDLADCFAQYKNEAHRDVVLYQNPPSAMNKIDEMLVNIGAQKEVADMFPVIPEKAIRALYFLGLMGVYTHDPDTDEVEMIRIPLFRLNHEGKPVRNPRWYDLSPNDKERQGNEVTFKLTGWTKIDLKERLPAPAGAAGPAADGARASAGAGAAGAADGAGATGAADGAGSAGASTGASAAATPDAVRKDGKRRR